MTWKGILHMQVETKQVLPLMLLAVTIIPAIPFVDLGVHPKGAFSAAVDLRFVEIYVLSGGNLERRSPKVGEEFHIEARVRNGGQTTIYYLPTLCDTSLSAIFDPSHVKVETGRPRCLAVSMPTALRPREESTVSAPESGTAYIAIRGGSTTATVVFTYNSDEHMDSSTQRETQSAISFTIQDGFPIPGSPMESLILGFALSIGLLIYNRKLRNKASR